MAVALLLLWTAVFTDSIAAEGDSDTVTLINSDEALPGFDYVKDVRVFGHQLHITKMVNGKETALDFQLPGGFVSQLPEGHVSIFTADHDHVSR